MKNEMKRRNTKKLLKLKIKLAKWFPNFRNIKSTRTAFNHGIRAT